MVMVTEEVNPQSSPSLSSNSNFTKRSDRTCSISDSSENYHTRNESDYHEKEEKEDLQHHNGYFGPHSLTTREHNTGDERFHQEEKNTTKYPTHDEGKKEEKGHNFGYRVESASNSEVEEDQDSDDQESSYDGTMVLQNGDQAQKEIPSFGNISVMNSNDVHFGNKTFYQGPVTIKQFLYTNNKLTDGSDSGSNFLDSKNCVLDGGGSTGETLNGSFKKVNGCAIKKEVVLNALNLQNNLLASGLNNPGLIGGDSQNRKGASDKAALDVEANSGVLKGFRRMKKFSKENPLVLVILLTILVISLIILMAVLLGRPSTIKYALENHVVPVETAEQEHNTPIESPVDPATNLTQSGKLKLVSRLEWLAQPPVDVSDTLKTPVPYVIIAHTATENCSSQAQCVFHVRYIQTFHIESRNWWDIGYNFLVGGDGEAYEGRGWTTVGAHTYGYNAQSIGIAFIGTFINMKPPERQMQACKLLIQKGVELGYISKDYKLLAAKQLQATQSPGEALYEELKKWDHWSPKP